MSERDRDHVLGAARAAASAGDARLLASLLDAIDPARHDAFELTALAVDLKEAGQLEPATGLLRRVVVDHPRAVAGWYELAVMHRLADRPREAIACLGRLGTLDPDHPRARLLLAHMLHATGAHEEAESVLARVGAEDAERDRAIETMRGFGRFLAETPRGRAHYLIDEVSRRYRWLDTAEVATRIRAALDARTGFALVRLGDGEGVHARIDDADEARHRTLYAGLRHEWAQLLYGRDFDPIATGYASFVTRLMDTSCAADIVGVPYRDWVDHEYAISSIRGIPCLVNVHRHLLARQDTRPPLLCDQRIHVQLHAEGHLDGIVRSAGKLAAITCIPELGERLRAHFGIDDLEIFKIPAERYSSHLRCAASTEGIHFPFVFWELVRQLSRPQDGRLFLIAAGTLAKFYADVIKRHGGVALDLGSLVDAWMRIGSRPGYGASLALADATA